MEDMNGDGNTGTEHEEANVPGLEALRVKARGLKVIASVERLETKFGVDAARRGLRLKLEARVGQTWAPEGYPMYIYETI